MKIAKQWHPDKFENLPQEESEKALAYFTHVSKAYEHLYDNHKRAIYDDDSISDSDYFTLKIGKIKINLVYVFMISLGSSVLYFAGRRYGLLPQKNIEG